MFCFFFFKQKTAYEMRISDWSSDVCSSDLGRQQHHGRVEGRRGLLHQVEQHPDQHGQREQVVPALLDHVEDARQFLAGQAVEVVAGRVRSEEHTSELQSLMRISYAVFCLKKKKTHQQTHNRHTTHNT